MTNFTMPNFNATNELNKALVEQAWVTEGENIKLIFEDTSTPLPQKHSAINQCMNRFAIVFNTYRNPGEFGITPPPYYQQPQQHPFAQQPLYNPQGYTGQAWQQGGYMGGMNGHMQQPFQPQQPMASNHVTTTIVTTHSASAITEENVEATVTVKYTTLLKPTFTLLVKDLNEDGKELVDITNAFIVLTNDENAEEDESAPICALVALLPVTDVNATKYSQTLSDLLLTCINRLLVASVPGTVKPGILKINGATHSGFIIELSPNQSKYVGGTGYQIISQCDDYDKSEVLV